MKRFVIILFIALLGASFAMATGTQMGGGQPRLDGAFTPYPETLDLHMARQDMTDGGGLPDGHSVSDNLYIDWILQELNINVLVDWVTPAGDDDAYQQKIALALVSDDLPDAMVVPKQMFYKMVDAGALADLDPYYNANISDRLRAIYDSYGDKIFDLATVNRQLFGLPATNIGYQHNLTWVRTDWLDNVGLDKPSTLDDILEIALAFKNDDPDSNGVDDTVGLLGHEIVAGSYNTYNAWDPVFNLYGSYPRQWIRNDAGEVTYGTIEPETKDALAALRQAFAMGAIDQEFATRGGDGNNAMIADGKSGIIFGAWWMPFWPLNTSYANDKNALWEPVFAPVDPIGKMYPYSQDPIASVLVVSDDYSNPEAVIKLQNISKEIIDNVGEPMKEFTAAYFGEDGRKFVEWGTAPINIQVAYETAAVTTYIETSAHLAGNPLPNARDRTGTVEVINRYEAGEQLADGEWMNTLAYWYGGKVAADPNTEFMNPVFFGSTDTMVEKWASLEKMEDEILVQIIMGDQPLSAFDDFVEEWLAAGGQEIIEEVKDIVD